MSITILNDNGLLLFITPTNVKNYLTLCGKNRDYIDNFYDIKYLSLNTANKYFKVGSTFAYFILKKQIVDKTNTIVEFIRNDSIVTNIISVYKGFNIPLTPSEIDIRIINKTSNLISSKHDTFGIMKALYNKNGKKTLQRIRKSHILKNVVKKK